MSAQYAFRLIAALFAFTAALSSPVVALAHGEAHEHELREHAQSVAPSSAVQPASAELNSDVENASHLELHADCLAKVASNFTLALASAPQLSFAPAAVLGTLCPLPLDAYAAPLRRAAPPDQPRAPPVV